LRRFLFCFSRISDISKHPPFQPPGCSPKTHAPLSFPRLVFVFPFSFSHARFTIELVWSSFKVTFFFMSAHPLPRPSLFIPNFSPLSSLHFIFVAFYAPPIFPSLSLVSSILALPHFLSLLLKGHFRLGPLFTWS